MTLITPAPQYAGQYGALPDGTAYEAVHHDNSMHIIVWRRIPFWDILTRADYIARRYLGQRIATLRTINGLWT